MTIQKTSESKIQLTDDERAQIERVRGYGYEFHDFHAFSRGGFKLVMRAVRDGVAPFYTFFQNPGGRMKGYFMKTA